MDVAGIVAGLGQKGVIIGAINAKEEDMVRDVDRRNTLVVVNDINFGEESGVHHVCCTGMLRHMKVLAVVSVSLSTGLALVMSRAAINRKDVV